MGSLRTTHNGEGVKRKMTTELKRAEANGHVAADPRLALTPKLGSALARFKMVQKAEPVVRGRARRTAPGVIVPSTGTVSVNTAAAELFDSLALEQGLKLDAYGVWFGADVESGHVAAVVVGLKAPGATPVRRDDSRHTLTLYMSSLFEETPEIRPASTRTCHVSREPDGDNGHYLNINLNAALEPRPVRKRAAKSGSAVPVRQSSLAEAHSDDADEKS